MAVEVESLEIPIVSFLVVKREER